MSIQVNPILSPRIITVPVADGDSISIQSLVNQIRNWEDNQANLCYPRLLSASGKESLGGDALVGITAKLENTKVMFEERENLTTCNISGGNLVAVDIYGVAMFPIEPSTNVTVQLAQSSSPTLLQDTDIDAIKAKTDNLPAHPAYESEYSTLLNAIQTLVDLIKQIQWGRWKILNNQMIFYDSDNETPIRTFNLYNSKGQPAEKDVYERKPVV